MKKVIWLNRSNGQLCVTIPKNSGMKEGDIVSIEKEKIKTIVYSSVTADLFHYGHLRLLENANKLGDFHICGVLTNEAIKSYREESVADFKERLAIVSSLRCVDMVMTQHSRDPSDNLRKIHEQFPDAKIKVVYGSNWKKADFVKKIKGEEVVHFPFYWRLSNKNIIDKIFKIYKRADKK